MNIGYGLRNSSWTLSWRRSPSYRNHSIDLLSKLLDCFLYARNLRHERVKSWSPSETISGDLNKTIRNETIMRAVIRQSVNYL